MCAYCEDLRYIEPAKYISVSGGPEPKLLTRAKRERKFLESIFENGRLAGFYVIEDGKCPYCGKELVLDDYD